MPDFKTYRLINGEEVQTTNSLAEFSDWITDLVFSNDFVSFHSEAKGEEFETTPVSGV